MTMLTRILNFFKRTASDPKIVWFFNGYGAVVVDERRLPNVGDFIVCNLLSGSFWRVTSIRHKTQYVAGPLGHVTKLRIEEIEVILDQVKTI